MATTKFFLDTRLKATCSTYPLRINLCHHSRTVYFNLGIKLSKKQWDSKKCCVINHPEERFWSNYIAKRKVEIETIILKLEDEDPRRLAAMSAIDLRDWINTKVNRGALVKEPKAPARAKENTFLNWFDRFKDRKGGRTKEIYEATRKRLIAWLGEEKLSLVKFEDIKVAWLEDFEDFLKKTSGINAMAIHIRNIRAVVNYAIDNDITTYYAFRRFKIKSEPTRKRNFDVITLRKIFNHHCAEEWQQKYLDFFKLSFMLIGINVVDLCGLTGIFGGRIEYIRAKTHRPYSIKVENEAKELIDRYAGKELLVNFAEGYKTYRHFYNNLSINLRKIKTEIGIAEFTTYWARHSWATIAHKLGISRDTIALALGHGLNDVTDIYIEYDLKAVDEANRKVLDYVLYGIKSSST